MLSESTNLDAERSPENVPSTAVIFPLTSRSPKTVTPELFAVNLVEPPVSISTSSEANTIFVSVSLL